MWYRIRGVSGGDIMKKTILEYSGKGIEETQKWIDENRGNYEKQGKILKMQKWLDKARLMVDNPITVISYD